MQKGYTIDCNYIVSVKHLMLPRPSKRIIDSDGEILPIITMECDI